MSPTREIALRRVLPAIQLVLFIALLVVGDAQERERKARESAKAVMSFRYLKDFAEKAGKSPAEFWRDMQSWNAQHDRCREEDRMIVSDWLPPAPVPAAQIAAILNGPAMFGGLPAYFVYNDKVDRCQHKNLAIWFGLPFVPLLWFLVGRALDVKRGMIAPFPPWHKAISMAAYLLAILFLFVALFSTFRVVPEIGSVLKHPERFFAHGMWSGWPARDLGVLVWSSMIGIGLLKKARHDRASLTGNEASGETRGENPSAPPR